MTDNPLLTGPVQTSDGREAVVLHHRCTDYGFFADVRDCAGRWTAYEFDLDGNGRYCDSHLIPRPVVHPNLTGTRTWRFWLDPSWAAQPVARNTTAPYAFLTLTDGDPASAVVEVVLPKGEG